MAITPKNPNPFAVLYFFLFSALIYRWCFAYAEERGIEPPFGASILAAFLVPIGVPIYFFRLLPFFAAGWATLKAVGFCILALCTYALGVYVVHT